MDSKFDYSQFKEYIDKFENMTKTFDNWLKSFLVEQAQKCIERTKSRQRGLDLIDTGYMVEAWYIGNVEQIGNNLQITLGNPAEYASYVEYGHSQEIGRYVPAIGKRLVNGWVEGGFMFTISLDEVQRALPTRFEREFKQFLTKWGVD